MAKLFFSPIGEEINYSDSYFENNLKSMQELDIKLEENKIKISKGWGEKYIERVKNKNKLTAYERIIKLADDKNLIRPIGTFVNYNLQFGDDNSKKSCPFN